MLLRKIAGHNLTRTPRSSRESSLHAGSVSRCRCTFRCQMSASAASKPSVPASVLVGDLLRSVGSAHCSLDRKPLSPEEMLNLTSLLSLTTAQPGTTTTLDVRGVAAAQNDLRHLQAHVLEFLRASVHHQEPLEIVEGAMLLLEQLSLKETTTEVPLVSSENMQIFDTSVESLSGDEARPLDGRWQMIVTTEGAWPSRLQYVPVLEFLEIEPDEEHFKIESKVGPLTTTFLGSCKWLNTRRLSYMVDEMRVNAYSLSFKLPVSFPENELMVFAVANELAVARTRSGGLMLLCRFS